MYPVEVICAWMNQEVAWKAEGDGRVLEIKGARQLLK